MKTLECKVCGHIEFDEAPEFCLVCRSPKTAFKENPEAIKHPADPANLTDGDKKHIPAIKVTGCGLIEGCTDVHAVVGEIEHVMEAKHLIRYLDYYINHQFASRVWLSAEHCHPATSLHLKAKPGDTVTVIENCNVHGNWMSEVTL